MYANIFTQVCANHRYSSFVVFYFVFVLWLFFDVSRRAAFFFSIQFNKLADMDIVLIVFSVLFMIIGLLGCILPALPGPPLSYIGFLLLHFTDKVQFSTTQILVLLLLVVVAQIVDYFIPVLGSKYSGGTKWGSWGAFIGSVVGLFFLPWGLLLGPFLGAVAGELMGDADMKSVLRSGTGALVGFLLGTVLKLALCMYFIVLLMRALI